ncbi:hypothetical protein IFM89_014629 [Coptis chinensis]|uniref:Uncharacterized protein n=1 Tax=Coptis chinensis TaxID=261450 RepID=A0A835HW05_9MAGN|nr:hypothetical protein IFM89_014629 [Coptis chinensis]
MRNFLRADRPIASIAFHTQGEVLAVALGHKVNDLDSPYSPMTIATSAGYLHYPPLAVYVANVHSGVRSNLEASSHAFPFLVLAYFCKRWRTGYANASAALWFKIALHR